MRKVQKVRSVHEEDEFRVFPWIPVAAIFDIIVIPVIVGLCMTTRDHPDRFILATLLTTYSAVSYLGLLAEYAWFFFTLIRDTKISAKRAGLMLWRVVWMRQRERLVAGALFYALWLFGVNDAGTSSTFWDGVVSTEGKYGAEDVPFQVFLEFWGTATSTLTGVGYGRIVPVHWGTYTVVNVLLSVSFLLWMLTSGVVLAALYDAYKTRRKEKK